MKKQDKKNIYIDKNRRLIEDCKKGSSKAQFEIYRLYSRVMFNTSFRILNNRFEAEDAMQEGFLNAFESIEQYREEVSFGAWLKRIIINKSIDILRKKKRTETEPLENHDIEVFEEDYPGKNEAEEQDLELIKKEIANLPEGFRIVLSLYLLEGYDHDEISKIMGISASTSRSQYSRAKTKLQLNLKKKKMKLEDLIRDNKDFFDDQDPFPGHQQRFRRKLNLREFFTGTCGSG